MDKVPSEMVYLPDGTFMWGLQASPESIRKGGKCLQHIKLLLDPSQEFGDVMADLLGLEQVRSLLPPAKKPVDVVADYLQAIKAQCALDNVENTLKNRLRNTHGAKFYETTDIKFYITVPVVSPLDVHKWERNYSVDLYLTRTMLDLEQTS